MKIDTDYNGAGIYVIINTESGRKYIGQSEHVAKRIAEHFSSLRRGKHNNKGLQADFDNGIVFDVEILERLSGKNSRADFCRLENKYIDEATNPYNIARNSDYMWTAPDLTQKAESVEKRIVSALTSIEYTYRNYYENFLPMDGSETPAETPKQRAVALAIDAIAKYLAE